MACAGESPTQLRLDAVDKLNGKLLGLVQRAEGGVFCIGVNLASLESAGSDASDSIPSALLCLDATSGVLVERVITKLKEELATHPIVSMDEGMHTMTRVLIRLLSPPRSSPSNLAPSAQGVTYRIGLEQAVFVFLNRVALMFGINPGWRMSEVLQLLRESDFDINLEVLLTSLSHKIVLHNSCVVGEELEMWSVLHEMAGSDTSFERIEQIEEGWAYPFELRTAQLAEAAQSGSLDQEFAKIELLGEAVNEELQTKSDCPLQFITLSIALSAIIPQLKEFMAAVQCLQIVGTKFEQYYKATRLQSNQVAKQPLSVPRLTWMELAEILLGPLWDTLSREDAPFSDFLNFSEHAVFVLTLLLTEERKTAYEMWHEAEDEEEGGEDEEDAKQAKLERERVSEQLKDMEKLVQEFSSKVLHSYELHSGPSASAAQITTILAAPNLAGGPDDWIDLMQLLASKPLLGRSCVTMLPVQAELAQVQATAPPTLLMVAQDPVQPVQPVDRSKPAKPAKKSRTSSANYKPVRPISLSPDNMSTSTQIVEVPMAAQDPAQPVDQSKPAKPPKRKRARNNCGIIEAVVPAKRQCAEIFRARNMKAFKLITLSPFWEGRHTPGELKNLKSHPIHHKINNSAAAATFGREVEVRTLPSLAFAEFNCAQDPEAQWRVLDAYLKTEFVANPANLNAAMASRVPPKQWEFKQQSQPQRYNYDAATNKLVPVNTGSIPDCGN